MKTRYIAILGLIMLAGIVLEALIWNSNLGDNPRLGETIETAAVFVALVAAVIALSTADPRDKITNVGIRPFKQNKKTKYAKKGLPQKLLALYSDYPDPFHSQQVHFVMKNVSGFTLVKPTLAFRLPIDRQQPQHTRNGWVLHFNSNLYNSQADMRQLEFNDTIILSNSNLPYWNNNESLTIWIRMILDGVDAHPFPVEVSVNCQNAQGYSQRINIDRRIPLLPE